MRCEYIRRYIRNAVACAQAMPSTILCGGTMYVGDLHMRRPSGEGPLSQPELCKQSQRAGASPPTTCVCAQYPLPAKKVVCTRPIHAVQEALQWLSSGKPMMALQSCMCHSSLTRWYPKHDYAKLCYALQASTASAFPAGDCKRKQADASCHQDHHYPSPRGPVLC